MDNLQINCRHNQGNNRINSNKLSKQSFYQEYHKGSIFESVLFNLFINGLFFFIKEAELAIFADDNIMYGISKDLTELLEIL